MTAQPNQSLIHGIACLQAVSMASAPVGPRELGRQLGLHHTKAGRLLGTLAQMEMVERMADGKYRPGPGIHALAAQAMAGSRLLAVALPELMRLRAEGFTVSLGVLWQDRVCCLLAERVHQTLEDALRQPRIIPASHTSTGIALMAARGMDPTAWTWPEHPLLIEHSRGVAGAVREARRAGYAVRRFRSREVSVGVAFGSPPLAGLAVSTKRLDEACIPEIVVLLRESAGRIVRELEATRA